MLPVDLTSTWIPLSLLAVLCTYMFILFQRERRASLAFESVEPAALGAAQAGGHGGDHAAPLALAPVEAAEVHATPVAPAEPTRVVPAQMAAPEKVKASLIWRTAYIWLPFVAGFAGQGYLDVIRPLVVKAAS